MKKEHKIGPRLGNILSLLIFLGLAACDTTGVATDSDTSSSLDVPSAAIIDELGLSGEEAQEIVDVMRQFDSNEPGRLWYVSAELQKTLSVEQKEALISSSEEVAKARKEARGEERGNRMAKARGAFNEMISGLTEEQKEQLNALREEQRESVRALMEQRRNGSLDEAEAKAQIEQIREQASTKLAEILTEDQLAELEAKRDARKERFNGQANGDRPGLNGRQERRQQRAEQRDAFESAMINALDLTSEQQAQLEEIRESHREAMENARDQFSSADREEAREMVASMRDAMQEARNAVLTDEQEEIISIHNALMVKIRSTVDTESSKRQGRRKGNRSR